MLRWLFAMVFLLVAVWEAPRVLAQLTITGVGSAGTGGPPPPPPLCSNGTLNFSQACNAVFAH